MRFSMRQIEGMPGQTRYVLMRGSETIGAIACSERTNPGVLLYDVSVRNVSWQVRMPSVIECAEALGTNERPVILLGSASRDGSAHTGRISSQDEPDGLVGRVEFYELELSGRMYRAYPVSLGQRGCHLPIYEVCNPEDDTLGDQIAVAKVRGTSYHTPKAFHVACIDSRAAVVAALFVCYDCHMSYLERSDGGRAHAGGRFRLLGGTWAARLDDPGFEERVGE